MPQPTTTEVDTAILEMNPDELKAAVTDWPAFLKLRWPAQQRIRELVPGLAEQLEAAHFRKVR